MLNPIILIETRRFASEDTPQYIDVFFFWGCTVHALPRFPLFLLHRVAPDVVDVGGPGAAAFL